MFDFVCASCLEDFTWKHLAFTFEVDGVTEGVCGHCASPEGSE